MKNLYKAALLAALGMAGVTAAQAQSDMLLGFNDAGANVSSASYQNDYVIDLGAIGNFTTTSTGSFAINQTTFDSAFVTPDANWANEVAVGVVAENNAVSPKQVYVSGLTAPAAVSTTRVNNMISDASNIAVGEYTTANGASAQNGWSYQVGVAPGDGNILDGNSISGGTDFTQVGTAPEHFLSNGSLVFNLYQVLEGSGTSHSFSEIGTFTVNANDGVDSITYQGLDASAAPEPATYGIFGAMGLLALALRRQLTGKLA